MLRLLTLVLVLAATTATLTTQTGCSLIQSAQNTERTTTGEYFDVQEDWIVLVSGAIILYDEGKIDQDDWDHVWYPIIREGNIALDEFELAAQNGDETKAETLRRFLVGLLQRLQTQTDFAQRKDE